MKRPPTAHELQAAYESSLAERRRLHGAAPSTVDALMYSLRERGFAALAEEETQERLAKLSPAQIDAVILRLDRCRDRWPAIDDRLLIDLGGRR